MLATRAPGIIGAGCVVRGAAAGKLLASAVIAKQTVLPPVGRPLAAKQLTLTDLESVRLLLRGRSVVDWHRLDFRDHADVDRFLRVNEFDPHSQSDMNRLEDLRADAVGYVRRAFGLRLSRELAEDVPARDLLLMASRDGSHRGEACMLLKVMHIVHHLAGHELAVRLAVSDDAIFRATELKVMQVVEELRAAGHPIEEFEWSRKSRDSLITKLLAKRSTLAANVYDKLRFRLIVPNGRDLLPMISTLMRQLIPFNYVIPEESVNHLVRFDDVLSKDEALRTYQGALHPEPEDTLSEEVLQAPVNEFSAEAYRIINFVADLPLRVGALMPADKAPKGHGHIVFVLTEFQLADKPTALANELGEASHEAYKARQKSRVKARLILGNEDALADFDDEA